MKKLIFLWLALMLAVMPATAQPTTFGSPYSGFYPDPSQFGDATATYLTLTLDPKLPNSRLLAPTARFVVTDNGAGHNYVLDLATVPIGYGGTGATSQQGAVNAILGFSGETTGDMTYYNGTNWVRLPIGSSNQVLVTTGGIPTWSSSGAGVNGAAKFYLGAADATMTNGTVLTNGTGIAAITYGTGTTTPIAVDTTVVATTTNTLALSNKTLTAPIFAWNSGSGVSLAGSAFTSALKWADWSAARTITLPDPGVSAANIVEDQGNYTFAGTETFTNAPKLSSNTVTSSTGNTITFPNSVDTLVNLTGTQTLSGKTLTSAAHATSIVLNQTTANYTVTWANPAAARAYRFADVGTGADIAMTASGTTYTNGGIVYANGNTNAVSAAGTSGQVLTSGGAASPAWVTSVPVANGGTGAATLTAHGVLIGEGTSAIVASAVGTNGQVLTGNTGADPTWQSPAATGVQFGGNGVDGAVTVTTGFITTKNLNATTFATTASDACTLESGYILSATSTITLASSSQINIDSIIFGGFAGAVSAAGSNGYGVAPGQGGAAGSVVCAAGGGAGSAGAGGDGGTPTVNNGHGGNGGSTFNFVQFNDLNGSGGGGGAGFSSGTTGRGGNGTGHAIFMSAGNFAGSLGTISAIGAAGAAATTLGQGGGGGGGGTIEVYAAGTSSSLNANASGGAGGASAGIAANSGGGGGGFIYYQTATTTNVGTQTVSAGAAGTGGSGSAGISGSAGLVNVVTSKIPTLPFIVYNHTNGNAAMKCLSTITLAKKLLRGEEIASEASHHLYWDGTKTIEPVAFLASTYCKKGAYADLCFAMLHGGDASTAEFCDEAIKPLLKTTFLELKDSPFVEQTFERPETCDAPTEDLRWQSQNTRNDLHT